jgi:hypothetical protein
MRLSRQILVAPFLLLPLLAACERAGSGELRVVEVAPDIPLGGELRPPAGPSQLQMALVTVQGPTRLRLAPGHYVLQPFDWTDPTCGNCEDPATSIPATLALQLLGRRVELVGASPDSVFLHTGAGYGVLIEDCQGCVVRGVTITGGARDPDGRATNGAVVVRRSTARIEECRLRDNIGDSATVARTVVGIAGVVGREGADFVLTNCRIERNSWDGVAMYRGAKAQIHDNLIDGVDKARGAVMGGGRGVGIGLTWDAEAEVSGNLVRRYWKGIGVFVDAQATVRHNVVEDILTWGLAYWAAGEGRAVARMEANIVYQTGACGAMISRPSGGDGEPGFLRGNILVATGQDERYDSGEPYCPQRPIARAAVPERFAIEGNILSDNRQPGDAWPRDGQVTEEILRAEAAPLLRQLAARRILRESAFLQRFGSTP